ncbi:MAG: hypothetical protein HYV23_08715 [Deltaproteobacteria bacterium]|nr:hypothetical protein [Deltaproteobacteria bacterium]
MNTGYNQNVLFRGEVYHLQTEDGGQANPVVTTLLFKGGSVLASKKVSYAEMTLSGDIGAAVRSIMTEQHATMLRDLKAGFFHKENNDKENQ